jgi:wolfamin
LKTHPKKTNSPPGSAGTWKVQKNPLNHSIIITPIQFLDKKSLRNLKYHFAEDGCSTVQFALAKQLLEENAETDPVENHVQGVYWLLRASQQGHEESALMLAECYSSGKGINETNMDDVRDCLQMSMGERAARRAAQELFASLSNGEEYVTAAQLERRMREIYKLQKRRRSRVEGAQNEVEDVPNSSSRLSTPSPVRLRRPLTPGGGVHHISEAHLVSAAVNYYNGNLPQVSALSLSIPHPHALDHIPCFHRPFFHPLIFFSLLYNRLITVMAALPGGSSTLHMLIIMTAYAIFASDHFMVFIPTAVYYTSGVVMLLSTFKMLKRKQDFMTFRMWSGLFLNYGDENFDARESENQFLRNNMRPYFCFFLAFFVNLLVYPLIADQWLPHSEITVVSFLLTFVTLVAFMLTSSQPFPDYLVMVSFGLNVLAKYPYEQDSVVTSGWRFLDLKVPGFSTFVIGNGIEFCLSCRALLYLLIPGFLVYLAFRGNWTGIYHHLIPHCVTLSWLQICIISSQSATMFGLMRAALGLAGLLLFLPLFGILTLLIPIFAGIEWLALTDPTVRLVVSILAAVLAIFGSCFMAASHRAGKYITILQIAVCVVATVFLTLPYMTSNFDINHSTKSTFFGAMMESVAPMPPPTREEAPTMMTTLTWDTFNRYCNQPAAERVNKIKTQLRCSHLDGTAVHWEGVVSSVEIAKVKNLRAELIRAYLPRTVAESIVCFYGEQNEEDCEKAENCDEIRQILSEQRECNVDKWNR